MPFSNADYNKILEPDENRQLYWDSKEKYAQYKKVDPFPEIGDALLNSVDIVKYCMTTGMIDPFDIQNVKGVTYTCHFSGRYFYWDGKADNLTRKTEADDPELILRPNSITYLEIKEIFRVPDYLIIRYNLQVNHVYKGLLLGTGPIVDPGFVGRLFIPLHNLTSNQYKIQKDASLITLEFTKIGRNQDINTKTIWPEAVKSTFDFSVLKHQPEEISPMRDFSTYLQKALLDNELFRSTKDSICVGSSIPEKVESAEESARAAEKAAKSAEKSAEGSKASLESTKKVLYGIGIAGVLALVISLIVLINDVNGRIDSVLSDSMSISAENIRLQEDNDKLLKEIDDLQNRINRLTSIEADVQASNDSQ